MYTNHMTTVSVKFTSGTKVLLIHGWGGEYFPGKYHRDPWASHGGLLVGLDMSGLEVITPTIPGFDGKAYSDKPWTVDDFGNWLAELIDKEKPSLIIGHSFGGLLVTHWRSHHDTPISVIASCPALERVKLSSSTSLRSKVIRTISKYVPLSLKNIGRYLYHRFALDNDSYWMAPTQWMRDTYYAITIYQGVDLLPIIAADQNKKDRYVLYLAENDDAVDNSQIIPVAKECGITINTPPGTTHDNMLDRIW